jgi:biotin transporter BioY
MKRISKWAQAHPVQSIYIIAFSHIIAGLNALFFGVLLFLYNWSTPTIIVLGLAHLFAYLYVFYPKKAKVGEIFRRPYLRQKAHDFGLVISCCLVISMAFANFLLKDNPALNRTHEAEAIFMVHDPHISSKRSFFGRIKSTLKEKVNELKVNITHGIQRAAIKYELHKKTDNNAGKVLLTVLTLGLSLLLGTLIMALSCNLSCSGQEGAAIIVLVLGGGAVIWLAVYIIREIWNKSKKEEDATLENAT